jgi:hypothetical protein
MVIGIEQKLGISIRWTSHSMEWKLAQDLLDMRAYHRALNNLEALIISRLFEMSKMNLSGTGKILSSYQSILTERLLGYKLRIHIVKALNARSQSIQRAIEKYNSAAQALSPPRPTLEWKQVVEYSFLADFDLLHDTNRTIVDKLWSQPTARNAMNTYFKLCQAREEIKRLNVETQRLLTFMEDEERFLDTRTWQLENTDPQIAFQIQQMRQCRSLVNTQHHTRLNTLSCIPGFSGVMTVGRHKGPVPGIKADSTPIAVVKTVGSNVEKDLVNEVQNNMDIIVDNDDNDIDSSDEDGPDVFFALLSIIDNDVN